MSRRPRQLKQQQQIAVRLQGLIDDRFGTYYAFRRDLEVRGHAALASTVRGWLPPQKRWKEQPSGRAVRRVDWETVKLPDLALLVELCDLLEVRADYLLFGEGSPYRGQSRDEAMLQRDLEARIWRDARYEVEQALVAMAVDHGVHLDTQAMLREMSRWARDDLTTWAIRQVMPKLNPSIMRDPEWRAADRRAQERQQKGQPVVRAFYVKEPPQRSRERFTDAVAPVMGASD